MNPSTLKITVFAAAVALIVAASAAASNNTNLSSHVNHINIPSAL